MSKFEEESVESVQTNKAEKDTEKIFTVPNIISFIRVILIIPFAIFFIRGAYVVAFSFLVLSGLSDCLDGFLARKLNQVTTLGKMLDPVADKLTLVTVIICLGSIMPAIIPLVIALVIKDVSMLIGGYYLLRKEITPPAAKWYGKMATIIFYVSVVVIVFSQAFLDYHNQLMVIVLLSATVVSMLFALIKYAIIFIQLLNAKDKSSEKVKQIDNT